MNKLNYIIMNNQLLPCYFDKGRLSVTAAKSRKLKVWGPCHMGCGSKTQLQGGGNLNW